jgi:hypothetical protein
MALLQNLLAFASQHSDLVKQIEGLALNELIALIKQLSPNHPLFAHVALAIVALVEKMQGVNQG